MRAIVNFIPSLPLSCASRKNLLHLAVALWTIVSVAACSSMSKPVVTEESYRNWASHRVQMGSIDSWEIHARAAIFVKQEVYQVGINWRRDIDLFVIVIEAPFGQGVFRIESNLQSNGAPPIKLSMPDGQVYFDDSAEALLIKVLGWSIPVEGLKSWIKGLPLADTDYSFDLQADGRLKSLRQDGWRVNYLEYFDNNNEDRGLPRKMYLKHPNLALKIVIERWQSLEPEAKSPVLFPDFD
jgi:outer membrane lipoprotein LolB